MTNLDKYKEAFITTLDIKEEQLAGLEYESIPAWDSVGHMSLVAELEERFDIMMDVEDILALNSFETGKEILKKYDVEI